MPAKKAHIQAEPGPYRDNAEHITDELHMLDLLIQRRVVEFRLRSQAVTVPAGSQSLFISHEEVDWLLAQHGEGVMDRHPELETLNQRIAQLRQQIDARVTQSLQDGVFLALPQLARIFGLTPAARQAVVICLAPELYRKYDKLYAYLQDDITRKRPSVDLILDLLSDTAADRRQMRPVFSGHSPLFRAEILQTSDDPQSPSGSSDLARFLRLDPRVLDYLLGEQTIDERLIRLTQVVAPNQDGDRIVVDPEIKTSLQKLIQNHFAGPEAGRKQLVLHFHGPRGVGKRALALEICRRWQWPLLCLDLEQLPIRDSEIDDLLQLALREGLLLQAPVCLEHCDALFKPEDRSKALIQRLSRIVGDFGWLTFLTGDQPRSLKGIFEQALFHEVHLPVPDALLRELAWETALEPLVPEQKKLSTWAGILADQFRLTPGQIREAAGTVHNRLAMAAVEKTAQLTDLYAACRNQSNQKLSELALKITPRYSWGDIVLPEDKIHQLKEICSQVRHRTHVFGDWGFGCKLAHGKGLSVLFSGPPGTGKTLAAQVMARELGLDLYKIDLSGVVSKYIGETEKNLSTIFQEAETSNAVLFFDEADALFGKRTEVSDAHDRYANIEVSYLLQKMEEYEGIVIMATNLRNNIDEAFTRRIRFIVDIPFPDEVSRGKIWKTHFPPQAPVSDGIDYEFLAATFQIAGGNIKNIVLNAAFLAAENGGSIGMQHILQSTRREFEKMGKLWNEKHLPSEKPAPVRRRKT